ncbi:dUTPase [Neobacillus rhizosphaerae]|uniref:dUTPase n=1 Tax=Neobacillus rhizosphaerae TaxID=2880965 RepID=UPI003D2AA546
MKKLDKTLMTEAEKQRMRDNVNGGLPVDMLKAIFKMQHELDSFIMEKHSDKLPQGISEWVTKLTIAMEDEISEVRGEVNWKWWKSEKQIDIEKLHEEVIDLWHFLVALSQRVGLTPEKVFEVYQAKREENFKRQKGTSTEKDYRDGGNN